jgi:hypothetical protein
VVVLAHPDSEMQVRQMITILRLFVPGHSTREQVIPWREAHPLKLVDLARIKLIGLSKKIPHGIPKTVQATVTVLDFNKELLISPSCVPSLFMPVGGSVDHASYPSAYYVDHLVTSLQLPRHLLGAHAVTPARVEE